MNKAEKIILSLGLFLWVVGDLITTYIGLNLGFEESNPITHDIFQMTMLKIGVLGIILIFIDLVEKKNLNILKVPVYTALISVGGWYVFKNTLLILGVI